MHLSIFDLDKTLLKVNISFKYYFYLYKKRVCEKNSIFQQLFLFMQYRYFNLSLKSLHESIFDKFLKNKNYDDFVKHIDIFLDKYLDKYFYKPAVLRLQKAILENHYIALFSSSPIFLVKPIAEILKVNEYKASIYNLDEKNQFKKIDLIIDGEKKTKYATLLIEKLKISKENITVYSDSIDDLKLFNLAGEKIAVQPCRKLMKLSKQNNWEII